MAVHQGDDPVAPRRVAECIFRVADSVIQGAAKSSGQINTVSSKGRGGLGNLRPREWGESGYRCGRGFPKGERLWACGTRKANFFFLETAKFSEKSPKNGKKIRPAKFCGRPSHPSHLVWERAARRIPRRRPTESQFMTAFLLACECTADVAVTPGQAGGSVACPNCGRMLSVPKLRDLGRLRRQDAGRITPGPTWRPTHAVALLGSLVAAACWVAGLWFTPSSAGVVDEALLRSAVLSADDLAIYKVWNEGLFRAGVRRPAADEEQALLRRARFADGVRGVLHTVAVGAALAAAGAALLLWRAPQSSPARDAGAAVGPARP